MIVVLTGGTGGAKFVEGLQAILPPDELVAIVNTGDDLEWWGLHVSPDLDSITYALAGLLSRERGWGVEGDTFECLAFMRRMGAPSWFQLGDRDLATHLRRTQLLREGRTLTAATREIASSFGIRVDILPMSDDRVETRVLTETGELNFQEYFVRERHAIPVRGVRFIGADGAKPAPGVGEAIRGAEAVLIAPSNPITSIGPILAVPGIRDALRDTHAPVAAVSPIIGGAAVSGPAGDLMRVQGLPVSVAGVAQVYADFLDALVVDRRDEGERRSVEQQGAAMHVASTIMRSAEDKARLAEAALNITIGGAARATR